MNCKLITNSVKKTKHPLRKTLVLAFALLTVSVMKTQAQGFHIGVKAGANIFKVNGTNFDQGFQFGYNVGAFAEINFPGAWGIQPELLFNQTNYHTGSNFNSIFPQGVNDVKGKLNYLSIPLLLSFKPIPLLTLQAGPQFGILLNNDESLVNNGKDAFKKGDVSLVAGAQLNILKFKVGARYVAGLSNINDLGQSQSWKNNGFQVYAGIRIF
jgi:outer membrane protein with beta-barrel domain